MNRSFTLKIKTLALAACVAFSQLPTFALAAQEPKVAFELATEDDLSAVSGEAKVKVSIEGAEGDISQVNAAFVFVGDLEYSKVDFLQGSDDHSAGDLQLATPGTNTLTAGLISKNAIEAKGTTEMFIITFFGTPGSEIELSLDEAHSYIVLDGEKVMLTAKNSIKASAIESDNEATTASVTLTMDKVPNFDASNKDGVVTLTITNQRTKSSIKVNLSDKYRGNGTVASYTVKNDVLKGDKYTVEISGIGYVPYVKTDVTFDKAISLTNADFVPGDVNNDGKADDEDKAKVSAVISGESEYTIAADFNRDGYVDSEDLKVFETENKKDDNTPSDKDDDNSSSDNSSSGGGGGGGGGGGKGSGSSGGGGFSGGFGGTSATTIFTDLENHTWAKDAIYKLKNRGIIKGISATEFAPANNIKRGDFMLILTGMFSVNNAFSENFADVPVGSYYYNAIGSAKAAGIANGSGDNFMPENTITRQDLITLAYRAFLQRGYALPAEDTSCLNTFGDNGDISDYARGAMAAMVNAGIIQGSNGGVNPKGFATRAEVAVMCSRMLDLMK